MSDVKKKAGIKKKDSKAAAKKAGTKAAVKKAKKSVAKEQAPSKKAGLGKAKPKKVNKKEVVSPAQGELAFDGLEEDLLYDEEGDSAAAQIEKGPIEVPLSLSLKRQLQKQADDEGVSLTDLISELLAEAVTLRAFEIVERKNQMRGQPAASGSGNRGGNHNNHGNHGNHGNNRNQRRGGGRGMSHGRYQNIMDDKASFLEYVRNQERNRR